MVKRIYKPTHQLFFTAPAIYLIVWKAREGISQGFVEEWMELIQRREPSAKMIIVATHVRERQADIDIYTLQKLALAIISLVILP